MKSAFYDAKPAKIDPVGNGSYLYRWNIQAEDIETGAEGSTNATTTREQYSCYEVTVWGPLTSNKILESVISAVWGNNREQKLINEYNAAQLGVYEESEAKSKVEAYKAFLSERNRLKEQVEADCAENSIQ
jgi:hypothetical protein